jgi:hypothetical protein
MVVGALTNRGRSPGWFIETLGEAAGIDDRAISGNGERVDVDLAEAAWVASGCAGECIARQPMINAQSAPIESATASERFTS